MYNKNNNFRAKTTKEKIIENISDYAGYKVIYTLSKKHSPHTIVFLEDIDDSWFCNVIHYKTKSGIITRKNFIIEPDIPTWISYLESQGYEYKK